MPETELPPTTLPEAPRPDPTAAGAGLRAARASLLRAVGEPLPPTVELARAWEHGVREAGHLPLAEATELFADLAVRLLEALDGGDTAAAARIGEALVRAHVVEPAALHAGLAAVGALLGPWAATPTLVARLADVLGAVAGGFTRGLRDRTRGEQQQVTDSALGARSVAERARWDSEARYAAVFAGTATGICVAGLDGTLLEVNDALCSMFGKRREELLQFDLYRFEGVDPEMRPTFERLVTGEQDHVRRHGRYRRKDGSTIWTVQVISLIRDRSRRPRYVVGMVEDVTQEHLLQERLRHQAFHDPLTGLPNRPQFFERLEAALQDPAASVGILFLGLDGFTGVNNTLGHTVGDRLLTAVGRRLQGALGPDGHLVARLGGDEFGVLITHPSTSTDDSGDGSCPVAERALSALLRPVRLGTHDITISASAGVVRREDGAGTDAASLMQAADTTLRWAKSDGRNRYACFDPERHRADVDRLALSAAMPDALLRGEFIVEYQPLVRLRDRTMIGVEALVRWIRPDGTRLTPDVFVPLAEETGMIVPLGRWVLGQACRQAVRWHGERPAEAEPLMVSVNVAGRQLREPGFVADVARVLRDTGLPPASLQLELTESDMATTTTGPLESLRALARMGIGIAIDDFGTGYSNLAYLRELPVRALKLAGPFVSRRGEAFEDDGGGFGPMLLSVPGTPSDPPRAGTDRGGMERTGSGGMLGGGPLAQGGTSSEHDTDRVDAILLTHVIRLSHALGLVVTAEHVESTAQLLRLRGMGCDLGQGWLFSAAVDGATISALLHDAPFAG